ncbi:DNA-binding protein [Bacteroidia bacterium]|nr:DNA-binding protein [Bacteroidia bacterium]
MGLTEEEKKSVVVYRMEKAKETFAEIPILIENKLWRNAANRLYYACFYAAAALLINDGQQAHSHNGVKSLLSLNYAKTNRIEKSLIKTYGQLFNMRQRGDYEDWVVIDEEDIKPLVEPAEQFIQTIEKLILTK